MRVQRRLGAAAVALGVALSCALFAPANPARAVPVPVAGSVTSGYSSVSPKWDSASCPEGQAALSGGGSITDGFGWVALGSVVLEPTRVTVMAYEVMPYRGSWSVTAWVTCGPDDDGVVITWATGSGTSATKTATASCPAGKKLYGTGFDIQGADGQVLPSAVRPDDALTKVTVTAAARPGFDGEWSLVAYAACGDPVAHMKLRTARSAPEKAASKTATTEACPDGTHVHGSGAEIVGGDGAVVLETMAPASAALTRSRAGAQEHGRAPDDWYVKTYALCYS